MTIQRTLDASPAAVWPFLSDPERMNLWSLAKVTLDDPGEGRRADGVGALRSVRVRSGPTHSVLREVIQNSEPPSRMVYRVIAGVPLRRHRGEITLTPLGDRTALLWTVEMTFPVPGMDLLTRATVLPQLQASVDRLAEVVRGATPLELPEFKALPDEDTAALDAVAEGILGEQRALAERMERADDPRHWFAKMYRFVTECQLDAARSGEIEHRAWVLRLIPVFHRYYVDNLRRFLREAPGPCEPHWEMAFRRAVPRRGEGLVKTLASSFRDAVRAHIEADLPRALAEVHRAHYQPLCELVRFRPDYLLMTPIFREASERFMATLPSDFLPLEMRLARRFAPREAIDLVTARTFYDYGPARREAFERARELVGER